MIGGGKGDPSAEGSPFPLPNLPSSPPKTFDLIESLIAGRGMGRTVFSEISVSSCIVLAYAFFNAETVFFSTIITVAGSPDATGTIRFSSEHRS